MAPTIADLLVRLIQNEEIDTVFTVPGATALPLLSALSLAPRIRVVVAKDEAGAAFAADGYAWSSGKPGVVITIGGPGATNTLTALCCSAAQQNPVLLVSADVPNAVMGRRPAQDSSDLGIDVVQMSRPATALSAVGGSPAKAEQTLLEAFRRVVHERRPVHVALPLDVQLSAVTRQLPDSTADYRAARTAALDPSALTWAAELLRGSGKTAILVGRGARHAGPEILALAERLRAPVATTLGAKGVFPERHPLSLGVYSFGSGPLARAVFASRLEVIVAIGTGLGEFASKNYGEELIPRHALIQIDDDPTSFNRNYVCVPICGDARAASAALTRELAREGVDTSRPDYFRELARKHRRTDKPAACRSRARPVRPERVMAELARALPDDACVVADIGTSCLFAAHYLRLTPPQRCYLPLGFACMAHPLAASVGVRLGWGRPTVCVTGDAAFLAKGLELHAAVEHGLDAFVWIVLSNGGHGLVRLGNEKLLGPGHGVESGSFGTSPDIAAIARAVGARGVRVEEPGQLSELLEEAFTARGPVLLDVIVDRDAEPPMSDRVEGFQTGPFRDSGAQRLASSTERRKAANVDA